MRFYIGFLDIAAYQVPVGADFDFTIIQNQKGTKATELYERKMTNEELYSATVHYQKFGYIQQLLPMPKAYRLRGGLYPSEQHAAACSGLNTGT